MNMAQRELVQEFGVASKEKQVACEAKLPLEKQK